ncbi:hypothetical protein FRC02_002731 [Tulasnella sp. 418]|nr:hypothetical protein FRC02_002731 [Tulasnella sp. 418]
MQSAVAEQQEFSPTDSRGDAHRSVSFFPGSIVKGFVTRKGAQAFMDGLPNCMDIDRDEASTNMAATRVSNRLAGSNRTLQRQESNDLPVLGDGRYLDIPHGPKTETLPAHAPAEPVLLNLTLPSAENGSPCLSLNPVDTLASATSGLKLEHQYKQGFWVSKVIETYLSVHQFPLDMVDKVRKACHNNTQANELEYDLILDAGLTQEHVAWLSSLIVLTQP